MKKISLKFLPYFSWLIIFVLIPMAIVLGYLLINPESLAFSLNNKHCFNKFSRFDPSNRFCNYKGRYNEMCFYYEDENKNDAYILVNSTIEEEIGTKLGLKFNFNRIEFA